MEKLEKEEEKDEGVMMNLKDIEELRGIWIGSDVFGKGEKILGLLEFSRENHHFLEGVKFGLISYLGGDFFNWVFLDLELVDPTRKKFFSLK